MSSPAEEVKKYAVVHFTNGDVSVIPSNWRINNTQCKWPTSSRDKRTMIVKRVNAKDEWPAYECNLIGSFDEYEEALKAEKNYAKTTTDEEQIIVKRQKGKRLVKPRNSEDYELPNFSAYQKKDLPLLESESDTNSERDNNENFPDVIVVQTGERVPTEGKETETVSVVHMEAVDVGLKEPETEDINQGIVDIDLDKTTVVATDDDKIQMILEIAVENRAMLKILLKQQDQKSKETQVAENLHIDISNMLPLQNVNNLLDFENKIKEDEHFSLAVLQKLTSVGGSDYKNNTKRIMALVFSNDLGMLISWTGQKENLKVGDFTLFKVVKRTMWLTWHLMCLSAVSCDEEAETSSCIFNSMCMCSADQVNPNPSIDSIACYSVPFYRFPTMPIKQIDRIEILDSMIPSLEADTLSSCEIQALVFNNNKLQYISDKIFSSSLETLVSLDMSYNQLNGVPFNSLRDLKSLHWLNLHGNQISSANGDWSYMKTSLNTLFVGQNDLTEIADTSSSSPHSTHTGIKQLKSLTWLNADANRIHKIHKHSLPSSLKTVSFSYNLIENFPLDIIATMPHLEWLYLRGNHIKSIPDYTFSRKFWIQKIDLNQNYLKAFPARPFNSSIFVRDVFLGMNEFEVITANSFLGLDSRRIVFSYNQIKKIEDEAFQGISTTLEYLDLDHNRLKIFPTAITQLMSLRFLYISNNFLNELPIGSLENFQESLKAISLSGNRLSKIPSEALGNCTKLSYFAIASNQISEIGQDDFFDWGNTVQILNINNNRITNLNDKVFAEMPKLKELNLNYNPLRYVESEAFYGLTYLETLELSASFERDDLPYEAFKNLENLKYLYLDHNNFHEIKPNSFDSLREIVYLNLESNKIEAISPNLMKANIHSKLNNIVLSDNELSTIESGTFAQLENLKTVWLNGNKIKHLQIDSFGNLPQLSMVFLRNNKIDSISHGAFTNLPMLKQVDLQYNDLTKIVLSQFVNLSSPLFLNLSHNELSSCLADKKVISLESLDLRFNRFNKVPKCLDFTPLLKKLLLDYNGITSLEFNAFNKLSALEQLSLYRNNIASVDRKAFFGLQNLQTLDLSKNLINYLHNHQFSDMPRLRVLNLRENGLSYLPREVFADTQLEFLDIGYNSFSIVPRESLSDVGMTLMHLSLQSNVLEHIDVTSFPDTPYLNYLDISKNKLTILPDNVFTQLSLLQYLDLGFNPLRANFKELFHYAQNLRHLSLADTGIISTPNFPLPDLVHLNLSYNNLLNINKNSFEELSKLKFLDLSHCNLNHVPSHLWIYLNSLKELDLSFNPIKEISVDSFHGLKSLQILNIQHLKRLSKFESKAFIQLRILSEIHMQTSPIVDNFYDEFCYLLSHLTQLRKIKLIVIEHRLDDQLSCMTNKKLVHLEITGRNLQIIEKDAFAKITKNPSLTIKISGTQISELPAGLFSNMHQIQQLSIDVSNNMLTTLTPETFYGNFSTWDDIGTGLVSGGLFLSGNRFRCGCHLAWLGHWLRRWSRENFNPRTSTIEYNNNIQETTREGTCWDSSIEQHIPIMKLPPVDMSCQASALSSGAYSLVVKHHCIAIMIYVVSYLVGFGS